MTKKSKEIMNPEHPRWDEFCERLEGPEGCDFKKDELGKVSWRCFGRYDKRYAKKIMREMKGIDIAKTVEYFNQLGGHCDCEILFNVNR